VAWAEIVFLVDQRKDVLLRALIAYLGNHIRTLLSSDGVLPLLLVVKLLFFQNAPGLLFLLLKLRIGAEDFGVEVDLV